MAAGDRRGTDRRRQRGPTADAARLSGRPPMAALGRPARAGRVDGDPRGGRDQPHQRLSRPARPRPRSEEHTSELQSLMRISYAVFCLKKKKKKITKI